jgi:hypothetical protein
MMNMLAAIKALRDAALAKHVAKLADDAPTIAVARADNVVTLKPKRTLLSALASAGDYADDKPPTPISMPLLHVGKLHTATPIASEFDGDPRFADEATDTWRRQQTEQWRETNASLPRRDNR